MTYLFHQLVLSLPPLALVPYMSQEFYIKQTANSGIVTREEFLSLLQLAETRMKPLNDVISGVRLLILTFNLLTSTSLEDFYQQEDMIADFEALLANLELLAKRGNEEVRLNFR